MADDATRRAVSEIPLLKTNSGPRDKELWVQRLREEYLALIKYVENNKTADNDWFRLESNKEGTRSDTQTLVLSRYQHFYLLLVLISKYSIPSRYHNDTITIPQRYHHDTTTIPSRYSIPQ
ncbi:unnamed protein product [Oncorhynchus mykiss]|uniref:Ubiquitin-fold modifier-conjugating enzyme 1 n=1 Tax=Oncorhynchus mykiss TaxID=8022 RepID=A0A060Z779_ONCMY|nr:unnamed protein product [Oncorhynchus mykiss]